MTYTELKKRVLEANLQLPEYGLVKFTWGNVSEIDREKQIIAIKPSGVEYADMTVEDIVVVDMDGNVVEGSLKPSSDLDTHLELYRNFKDIGGVVHTHSPSATTLAQGGADSGLRDDARGLLVWDDPCTRRMTSAEIAGSYELETGKVIVETIAAIDEN